MADEVRGRVPGRAARLWLAALVVLVAVGATRRRALEPRLPSGLLVEVAGDVPRPGVHLVEVPTVAEAVAAAGGRATDGATAFVGGSRVVVRGGARVDSSVDPLLLGHRIDVNTAGAAVLQDLPGVGPATAGSILDHRHRRGPFRSVDELAWVRGIGRASLADLRPLVEVGDVPPREPLPPIDVNVASEVELQRLPGIGPARAAAIVADREAHGAFPDVAALDRVRGIGPATVAGFQDAAVASPR